MFTASYPIRRRSLPPRLRTIAYRSLTVVPGVSIIYNLLPENRSANIGRGARFRDEFGQFVPRRKTVKRNQVKMTVSTYEQVVETDDARAKKGKQKKKSSRKAGRK